MSTGYNRSELMKWAASIAMAIVLLVIPEQGIYTHQFKLFLAITVFGLALSAFELVHVMFIAIVMPSLWIFFGVADASVVMSPWVGTTMLLITGAFFLSATLEDCGLLKRIAYFLMCKAEGSYFKLLMGIMLVGIILNILTSGQAYLIIAPLAAGLCVSLGEMKTRMGAGIAAAAMLGGCTAHAYTYQATAWGTIMKMGANYMAPTDITPLSIMMHCWPMFVISIFIVWVISKWYKPENGMKDTTYFRDELEKMGAMTRREKANMAVVVILLVYIFTIDIHGLDLNLGFALIPWLVFLPGVNGANADTLKKMNVTMLFFVAACMSIGTVASSMGLGTVIADVCAQVLQGNSSPIAIMAIVFAIVFGLNFLMTPLAIFALIIEPICILATNSGFSPIPFAYAVNACSEAILLPYEYVPYLVVYGFGMITAGDFIKINAVRSVIFFGGFLAILIPYWMLIGLF